MKKLLSILLIIVFFSTIAFSQSTDTLKIQPDYENITAFYDKLNANIVISSIPENTKVSIEIFDITGLSITETEVLPINKRVDLPIWLKQGIYIIIIRNKNFTVTRKFRVN